MKSRNHTFDFLCGLCIIRMVMLHTFQFSGFSQEPWWKAVMDWSFYLMCFFFFKAGYFNRSVGGKTWPYIKDRTRRLLVPYLTCGMIGVVLFWGFMTLLDNVYSTNPIKFLWIHLWRVSDFYGNAPMWFLLSFYVMYIAVHFIEKSRWAKRAVVLFPLVGYVLYTHGNPLWLNLNNIFMGVFFFYLGQYWHRLLDHIGRRRMFVVSLVLVGVFTLSNLFFHGVYTMHSNDFSGNPWGAVINTIVIVCGLSGLFISLRMPRIPVINYIGEHSMVYFVLHFPILYFYKNLNLCFHHSMVGKVNDVIIGLILVFCICSWIVPYFERVPWLSGRLRKKTDKPATPAPTATQN